MKKLIVGLAAATVIAPLAMAGSAYAASTPTNLSFEDHDAIPLTDGYIKVDADQSSLHGWTVAGDGVDIVDESLWQPHDGVDSIDLNALGAGSISQAIDTVPGQTYNVSFWMSGNPDTPRGLKTMDVSASGTAPQPFTFDTVNNTKADMGWTQKTFSFAAAGPSTTLTFASTTTQNDPGFAGPVIDDLKIAAAQDVAKTGVWHTWTGGPVASAPSVGDAGWHPTNGDPQSSVHKYENHTDGLPYYVANKGNKGGSWFLWKTA